MKNRDFVQHLEEEIKWLQIKREEHSLCEEVKHICNANTSLLRGSAPCVRRGDSRYKGTMLWTHLLKEVISLVHHRILRDRRALNGLYTNWAESDISCCYWLVVLLECLVNYFSHIKGEVMGLDIVYILKMIGN